MERRFNIRVYGLLIDQGNILLSDERLNDFYFTKFPGGGLEFGEGSRECLKREFKEELGIEVEVKEHFYTTDFFVASAFNAEQQVISIYYFASAKNQEELFKVENQMINKELEKYEVFRWKKLTELDVEDLTFPIDKVVLEKLRERFGE